MKISLFRAVAIGCACLPLAAPLMAEVGDVTVGDPPKWVAAQDFDSSVVKPTFGSDNESVVYLLVDSQHRPESGETYRKRVYRVTSDAGVQQKLKVTIDFDPSYSELVIHDISIRRGKETFNKLDLEKMKIFQPEDDLSQDIYDEDKRCLVFLDDLRVDDIVVVEYTILGRNPALLGRYSYRMPIQFYVPVEHSYYRLVWDSESPISYQARFSDLRPEVRNVEGRREYLWSIPPQPSTKFEDMTPRDFDDTPYLEVTDASGWADVVEWGLENYKVLDDELDSTTRKLLDEWKQEAPAAAEHGLRALRFVQDKVRYVGIEIGAGGLKPAAPARTMECRYGDCKGKSVLLCAMLRYLGIEASPALVNTYRRGDIKNSMPTPLAFNHVIARLELDGKVIWVDPTISQQRGPLATTYIPPYGQALVIRQGRDRLDHVEVPAEAKDHEHVEVTFDVHDYDAAATMQVVTEFKGKAADSIRRSLIDKDYKSLSEEYLNFYAETYPGIRDPVPLDVSDDTIGNVVRIKEKYVVDNLFVESGDDQPRYVELYPFGLDDVLPSPETRIRKTPLAIWHPVVRTYKTTLNTPDALGYDDHFEEIKHPAFEFSLRQRFDEKRSEFEYSLETLRDRVEANKVDEFLRKSDKLHGLLGDYPEQPVPVDTSTNWFAIALVPLTVLVVGILAFLFCNAARFRGDGISKPGYETMGGWLLLVGFGVVLSPFSNLIFLGQEREVYFTWGSWTEWKYGFVLAFEVMANSAVFILAAVLAFTFLWKRKTFPGFYIFVCSFTLLVVIADNTLCHFLLDVPPEFEDYKTMSQMVLRAAIWFPYMLISKRVKGTFVH